MRCALLFWVCLLLGCSLTGRATHPVVITNHPPIALRTDPAPLLERGCVATSTPAVLDCTPVAALAQECPDLRPDPALAFLTPAPAGWCVHVRDGGALVVYEKRALAVLGDDVRLVPFTPQAMAAEFAPIDTPERAVAYALAMTGLRAINGLPADQTSTLPDVTDVHDTHARPLNDGFMVNLFGETQDASVNNPSCARYQTQTHVTISTTGAFSLSAPQRLWATGACVVN